MNKNLRINRIVSIALMTAVICVISPFAIAIPVSPVPISLATFAIYLTVIILGWEDGTISVLVYVLLGFAGAPVFTGFTGGAGKVLGPTGGYIIGYIFLAFIEGVFVEGARKARPYKEGLRTRSPLRYGNRPYKEGLRKRSPLRYGNRPYKEGLRTCSPLRYGNRPYEGGLRTRSPLRYGNRPYEETVGASYTSATMLIGMVLGTIVLYVIGTIWLMRQAGLTLVAALSAGVLPFIVGDIVKMLVALFAGTKIRTALVKSNLI